MPQDRRSPRRCQAPDCPNTFTPGRAGPIGRACSEPCRSRLNRRIATVEAVESDAGRASREQVMGYLYGEPDWHPRSWRSIAGALEEWTPALLAEFRSLAEDTALREAIGSTPALMAEPPLGNVRQGARTALDELDTGEPYGTGFGPAPEWRDRIGRNSATATLRELETEARFDVGSTGRGVDQGPRAGASDFARETHRAKRLRLQVIGHPYEFVTS